MTTHPRGYRADLPATGAWRVGDDPGHRQFTLIADGRPLALEAGGVLSDATLAYETWGQLADDASNAILVCHALTGDAHAAGKASLAHPTAGWWQGMIGPGKALDTDRYFVVCSNVIGGCQGSTGPASVDPATGRPYGSAFPAVTVRDMVRAQARLANALGIDCWLCVVGGSMGGMQALEWGIMFPERVRSIAPLAACVAATPQQIGWSAVGRSTIALDPNWRGGDYYDAPPGGGPHAGLAIARAVAQITYRSSAVYDDRFGREPVDTHAMFGLWDRFQVESYLDYHGEKLVRRFDANSYLILNRAMDLHDIARDRGGLTAAASRLSCPVLSLSISSDMLYWPAQQRELAELVRSVGGECRYVVIDSPHGHDGFLVETGAVGAEVADFLEHVEKSDG